VFAYGTLGVGWTPFSPNLELLYLLDDVVDRSGLRRIPHVVAPRDCPIWHIVGHSLFVGLQVGGAAVGGPVVGWRLNFVVGIPADEMTEELLMSLGLMASS